jgi:hypothetical protein
VTSRLPAGLLRAALALVAVVLIAWFAVLWRDEQLGREAANRILQNPGMSDADWSRSLDQLRQAELLNPGSQWETLRASALGQRNRRAAVRVADSIARVEPDNLRAWVVIANATRGRDERRRKQALAQIRRLNPPLPGR